MRPSWDSYFHSIAKQVATRATCPRASVGCVIVYQRQILTTGYNGSARGSAHCEAVGCQMEDGHCKRTVHAEANAIAQAARAGIRLQGASLYCTHRPCYDCLKLAVNSGIICISFETQYGTVSAEYETLAEKIIMQEFRDE